VRLLLGDAIARMAGLPDKSVGMVLTDPPYGMTSHRNHAWNNLDVQWVGFWQQVRRVVVPNGAVVIFAVQPFTTQVAVSNIRNFKYTWVWVQNAVTGALLARKRPMRAHVDILVFGNPSVPYYPIGLTELPVPRRHPIMKSQNYDAVNRRSNTTHTGWPRSVLYYNVARGSHPTQKPVDLCEYLIRTYSKPDSVVLDPFMGSGSTGVAAVRVGRRFVGIDNMPEWVDVARRRIRDEGGRRGV